LQLKDNETRSEKQSHFGSRKIILSCLNGKKIIYSEQLVEGSCGKSRGADFVYFTFSIKKNEPETVLDGRIVRKKIKVKNF